MQTENAVDRKLHEVERFKVDSSTIESIGFEDDVLVVEFKNGHIYAYSMQQERFEEFAAAESKGAYFNREIRGKFAGTKLTGACANCHAAPLIIGETCACGGKVVGLVSKAEAARLE